LLIIARWFCGSLRFVGRFLPGLLGPLLTKTRRLALLASREIRSLREAITSLRMTFLWAAEAFWANSTLRWRARCRVHRCRPFPAAWFQDVSAAGRVKLREIAPNMIVKIPVTRAGIPAIEEATYRGISINATVCFTLPQCIAVAEAVERGLKRREKEGQEIDSMGPVCTIMVGRLDDWLTVAAEKQNITIDPGYLEWAGVAVFKKTYHLFRKRGYRVRLLSAAFRNHMHWSEFIGGEVVISPPYSWQVRFNASDIDIRERIGNPVDPRIVEELLRKFGDFRRAYTEDGIAVQEFDAFPPTRRTLRQFIGACSELGAVVRDSLLPNPDCA
jgi:transaldolase